jgi:hypothetical protein
MLDGDAFAKRFGGETGDDPDFFKLTIKKYLNGSIGEDSVDFFLADYRFDNNDEDYLIRDWTWVDLTSLGDCDSLSFSLSSSDNGMFGMNTPAFFCIDNVTTEDVTTSITNIQADLDIIIYPNPASDVVRVECDCSDGDLRLIDSHGVVVKQARLQDGRIILGLGNAPSGVYYVQLISAKGAFTQALIKT